MKANLWFVLSLLAIMGLMAPFAQTAFALPPELAQVAHASTSGVNCTVACTVTLTSTVGSGDVLLVAQSGDGVSCAGAAVTIGDSISTVFTRQVFIQESTETGSVIWTGLAGSLPSATDVITITPSPTGCGVALLAAYDISAPYISTATPSASSTGQYSNADGLGPQPITSPTNTRGSTALAIGSTLCINCGNAIVAGTSFTGLGIGNVAGIDGGSEYSDTVTSPTGYPFAGSNGGDFSIVGVIMNTALQATVLVQACNFGQLQCWWYPMFFYMAYVGSFVVIIRKAQTSGSSATFFLLAGLAMCSLLQVQLGMMNILMPIAISFGAVVYAVRMK